MNQSRARNTVMTGVVLFVAGLTIGAFSYAFVGSDRFAIKPEVQNALVLAIGAIVAALLAAVGVYWAAVIAGRVASSEGEATRRETRRLSMIDERTDVVRRISVLASRHAQEVADQVARRQELAGRLYEPLPRINETTRIEGLINELYTLGFQATADVANALFRALIELDRFAYVATPGSVQVPMVGLSDDDHLAFLAWQRVQLRVKTHMIDVGLTDEGTDHLAQAGTLSGDYLDREYRVAWDELRPGASLATAFRDTRANQATTPQD
jgi:hypothetical protein